jgi:flagellar hook protein FlgE
MAYGDFVTSVGAEVGIVRRNRSYGGLSMARFGTVTKINGHGHIFVQSEDKEFVFTKRGAAYKDSYGPSLISAGRLSNELAREAERKERARVARELEAELKSGWSYSGTFHATAERIAAMKNLVAELENLVDSTI